MDELREIRLPDGTTRRLGNLGWSLRSRTWPTFSSSDPDIATIPRATWRELIDAEGNDLASAFLNPAHDQDGVGMCNCSATAGAAESQRKKQGLPYVHLSGGDLYHRICYRGQDSGSTLEDGVAEFQSAGIASVAVVPYMDWRGNHPEAVADRKRFRGLEVYLCPTFDHLATAALEGFDLVTGIMWGGSDNPDQDGWIPTRVGGGAGGHALHGYKLVYRSVGGSLRYGLAHQNSWGKWGRTVNGIDGLFVIPEERFNNSIGGWWAVRSMVDEGGQVPTP